MTAPATIYPVEHGKMKVETLSDNVNDKNRIYTLILRLVILGALIVTVMISLLSEFGMHPDEYDVRLCLDWCKTRWIWPDMRLTGQGLGDTYSGYGYTKVCNYTPYFLIAGKIAYVFEKFMGSLPYYRVPNLLLILLISVYMLKKLKSRDWLMLAFGICVQAWYIFSYVTADAMDFAAAFFALIFLADEESILWRTLRADSRTSEGITGSNAKTKCLCVLLGMLYGLVLLGKPYYWAVLVLTFIAILREIVKSRFNKNEIANDDITSSGNKNAGNNADNTGTSSFLARAIAIMCIAFAIFLARFSLDLYYYGTSKSDVKTQMEITYADPDKNPATPIEEQSPTYRMYSKGYSLADMFSFDPGWVRETYRSFVSSRVTVSGDEWYFILIGVLYAFLYVKISVSLIKQGDLWIFITGTALNLGNVIASVLNSYLIDCQPQGRYLLPILLTTAFMASKAVSLKKDKLFKGALLTSACLALVYFGLFDSRKLIDLTYARSLFH